MISFPYFKISLMFLISSSSTISYFSSYSLNIFWMYDPNSVFIYMFKFIEAYLVVSDKKIYLLIFFSRKTVLNFSGYEFIMSRNMLFSRWSFDRYLITFNIKGTCTSYPLFCWWSFVISSVSLYMYVLQSGDLLK